MAFKRITTLDGAVLPFEYQTLKTGVTCSIGTALSFDGTTGTLIKTLNTSAIVPDFISEQPVSTNAAGVLIQVSRVREEDEYIVSNFSATAVTADQIGTKMQLDASAVGVLDSVTNGVFQISWTDATTLAAGGRAYVRGYFKK